MTERRKLLLWIGPTGRLLMKHQTKRSSDWIPDADESERPLWEARSRCRPSLAGLGQKRGSSDLAHSTGYAAGRNRMPVRAPVTEPDEHLRMLRRENIGCQVLVFGHDHASVRVGSAAMPAPFALPRPENGAGIMQPALVSSTPISLEIR